MKLSRFPEKSRINWSARSRMRLLSYVSRRKKNILFDCTHFRCIVVAFNYPLRLRWSNSKDELPQFEMTGHCVTDIIRGINEIIDALWITRLFQFSRVKYRLLSYIYKTLNSKKIKFFQFFSVRKEEENLKRYSYVSLIKISRSHEHLIHLCSLSRGTMRLYPKLSSI